MSWSLGWDERHRRWVGYGVPAHCDHPECREEIDRGLAYVCGSEPFGGEHGCGLHFCEQHREARRRGGGQVDLCTRCARGRREFAPRPEHPKWAKHLATDPSWAEWRAENPELVAALPTGREGEEGGA